MSTLDHIATLIESSLALEQITHEARYSQDAKPRIPRAKTAFAVIVDEDGEVTVAPLHEGFETWLQHGPTPKKSKEEQEAEEKRGNAWTPLDPYETISVGANFEKVTAHSHARSKETGQSNPMQVSTDSALRARQVASSAKEKIARLAGEERNKAIFDKMRERSDQIWKKKGA